MNQEEYVEKNEKILRELVRRYIKMMKKEKKIRDVKELVPDISKKIEDREAFLEMFAEGLAGHRFLKSTPAYRGCKKIIELQPIYKEMLEKKLGREILDEEVYPTEWFGLTSYEDKAECLRQAIIKNCEITELELYEKILQEKDLHHKYVNMFSKQIQNGLYDDSIVWYDIKGCDNRIKILEEALQKKCFEEHTEAFKEYQNIQKLYREHPAKNVNERER